MLSIELFSDQMNRLSVRAFKSKIDKTDEFFQNMVAEYYEEFRSFDCRDIAEAVNGHTNPYFPDMAEFKERVIEAQRLREIEENKKSVNWGSIAQKTTSNLTSQTHKEMAKDIFMVLQSGDITPKRWRDLSVKYAEIRNQDAPGSKMGTWFMDRAMTLAKHRLEARREIRKRRLLY